MARGGGAQGAGDNLVDESYKYDAGAKAAKAKAAAAAKVTLCQRCLVSLRCIG